MTRIGWCRNVISSDSSDEHEKIKIKEVISSFENTFIF